MAQARRGSDYVYFLIPDTCAAAVGADADDGEAAAGAAAAAGAGATEGGKARLWYGSQSMLDQWVEQLAPPTR